MIDSFRLCVLINRIYSLQILAKLRQKVRREHFSLTPVDEAYCVRLLGDCLRVSYLEIFYLRTVIPSVPVMYEAPIGTKANKSRCRIYKTNGRIYRTKGKIYKTNGRIYRTKGKIYKTNGRIYRTKGKIYKTNGRIYRARCIRPTEGYIGPRARCIRPTEVYVRKGMSSTPRETRKHQS